MTLGFGMPDSGARVRTEGNAFGRDRLRLDVNTIRTISVRGFRHFRSDPCSEPELLGEVTRRVHDTVGRTSPPSVSRASDICCTVGRNFYEASRQYLRLVRRT